MFFVMFFMMFFVMFFMMFFFVIHFHGLMMWLGSSSHVSMSCFHIMSCFFM